LPTRLWRELRGFEKRYFMYGEDNDLCLRAIRLGYRPMFTPDCEIIHHGGGSIVLREVKLIQLLRGQATIVRDHWRPLPRYAGLALLHLRVLVSRLGAQAKSMLGKGRDDARRWQAVWQARHEWRKGY
jgi:N-acetylglucosaminyl-diphospho-decaprenol L-rhamnosyltransferase